MIKMHYPNNYYRLARKKCISPRLTQWFIQPILGGIPGTFELMIGTDPPFHRTGGLGVELFGNPAGKESQTPSFASVTHGVGHRKGILSAGDARIQQDSVA